MSKLTSKSTIIWTLTILLSFVFVGAGIAKLMGVEQTILPFERMGVPVMAILVGCLEIIGAIMLFVPRLRFLSALGLSVTMVGAIGYHLVLDPDQAVMPAIILFLLCTILSWLRRAANI